MSETIKINPKFSIFYNEKNYDLSFHEIYTILNKLLRSYSVQGPNNSIIKLSEEQLKTLSNQLKFSYEIIELVINRFLTQLSHFKKFMKNCEIRIGSMKLHKKVRIYLHKIHRIAPFFDYKRARINLSSLHQLFFQKNFWPSLSTQLTLLIYITDKLDKRFGKKILQKNIYFICNCSAYAFHRTKNRLEIDRMIIKNNK